MAEKNSFDLIRIIAAFLVMVSHSFALTGLPEPQVVPGCSLGKIGVDAFFALSGYLVFQSLDRDPHLFRFLARRSLRIFPGLAMMLLITVCLIGPMFSTLEVDNYFSHASTWSYLGKIKLWGNDQLPGVFESNPYPRTVNGSLWTLKWEWLMYCILGGIALIARKFWKPILISLSIVFGSLAMLTDTNNHGISFLIGQLTSSQNPFLPGSFFFFGALLSVWQIGEKIRSVPKISLVILACICGILLFFAVLPAQIALWLLISVGVVAIGESELSARLRLDPRNDLSYGLYIYAFPIQQCVSALFKHIAWWESLLIATPITAGVAFLSWCNIEKPALRIKNKITRKFDN